ncbi:hypothetical protein D3C72_2316350 [compost metagenome]
MRSAPDISTTSSVALRMLAMVSSERRLGLTLLPATVGPLRRSTVLTALAPLAGASGAAFFLVLAAALGASAS